MTADISRHNNEPKSWIGLLDDTIIDGDMGWKYSLKTLPIGKIIFGDF